ncbi:MAG: hypothetical protein JRN54_09720 [Nitrososphaerota archaeon]|nr:hypothetical protein [Nitrososphaerota archaeon]
MVKKKRGLMRRGGQVLESGVKLNRKESLGALAASAGVSIGVRITRLGAMSWPLS